VAVSGGQDSLCLLQLLLWLKEKYHWQLQVGHCDHRWRSDSRANADHVAQTCQQWGVECHLATAEQIPKSEAEARAWRYQALTEIATAQHCTHLVTGHTKSDRAETMIYNLVRGSGLDGLTAMAWSRPLTDKITLVRPLLEISRQETGEFCQTLTLPVYIDSTNLQMQYRRNRIRQELIPYLAQHFNPQVESALWQTAELLQADYSFLEATARQFWQGHDLNAFCLDRTALQSQPLALQRRIIKQFLSYHWHPHQQVDFSQVEKLRHLLTAPHRSQTDPLWGRYIAVVEQNYICLVQIISSSRLDYGKNHPHDHRHGGTGN